MDERGAQAFVAFKTPSKRFSKVAWALSGAFSDGLYSHNSTEMYDTLANEGIEVTAAASQEMSRAGALARFGATSAAENWRTRKTFEQGLREKSLEQPIFDQFIWRRLRHSSSERSIARERGSRISSNVRRQFSAMMRFQRQ